MGTACSDVCSMYVHLPSSQEVAEEPQFGDRKVVRICRHDLQYMCNKTRGNRRSREVIKKLRESRYSSVVMSKSTYQRPGTACNAGQPATNLNHMKIMAWPPHNPAGPRLTNTRIMLPLPWSDPPSVWTGLRRYVLHPRAKSFPKYCVC
jgi:hypothetical protein